MSSSLPLLLPWQVVISYAISKKRHTKQMLYFWIGEGGCWKKKQKIRRRSGSSRGRKRRRKRRRIAMQIYEARHVFPRYPMEWRVLHDTDPVVCTHNERNEHSASAAVVRMLNKFPPVALLQPLHTHTWGTTSPWQKSSLIMKYTSNNC